MEIVLTFDAIKQAANKAKHGYDFADLTAEWFDAAIVTPAHGHRFVALGWFDGSAIAVIFQPLGREALAIISMRAANRKERKSL
jgi:uncharacterized DUF497 family protein